MDLYSRRIRRDRPDRRLATLVPAAAVATAGALILAAASAAGPTGLVAAAAAGPVAGLAIHDIEGPAYTSPYAGDAVAAIPGIVTAVGPHGFWFQDPTPDADPDTSEAAYVYTGSAPAVVARDAVRVDGLVTNYRSGGAGGTDVSQVEIEHPAVTVTAHGQAMPTPVLLGPGGLVVAPHYRTGSPGDVESVSAAAGFDRARNALDAYRSLDGMLVEIRDAVAVGPTSSYDEISVAPGGSAGPGGRRSARGGVLYAYDHPNTERLLLSPTFATLPQVNVRALFGGSVDGILGFAFGEVTMSPLAAPSVTRRPLPPEKTARTGPTQISVATFNVENLSPGDPPAKFARLAGEIVGSLASPDILAVEEIQDDDGPTDDGVVDAATTWKDLIAAISAAGGPVYGYREIDPVNDADGGQPGGNIRQGFLFRTDRGVRFVDRAGGTATAADAVVAGPHGQGAALRFSPGRIDPASTAWAASRKPLAAQFTVAGRPLFLIANHFVSKGADEALAGRYQQPQRPSEAQRHAQAQLVGRFVSQILARDAAAQVVVLGDLNDYEFSGTANILVRHGLTDLPRTLPVNQRYTYDYEGNSEVLDHILVSRALLGSGGRRLYSYDIVHVNAEYAGQVSDHDPQVVRLAIR